MLESGGSEGLEDGDHANRWAIAEHFSNSPFMVKTAAHLPDLDYFTQKWFSTRPSCVRVSSLHARECCHSAFSNAT